MDSYRFYYKGDQVGVKGWLNYDDRLSAKELVVGVVGTTVQKAYPLRLLTSTPVLNDTVEGRSLVVVYDPETGAASAFDGAVDGESLTFSQAKDPLLMEDLQTGTVWIKASGDAVSGALSGRRLEQIQTLTSFWFAWTDHHPGTLLHTG